MSSFEEQFIQEISNTDDETLLQMLSDGETFYSREELSLIKAELKNRNVSIDTADIDTSANEGTDELDIPTEDEWEEKERIEKSESSLVGIINLSQKPIFDVYGNRGRHLTVYEDKCVIQTDVTIGSLISNNATDGEKLIYYKDIIGVQYKVPGFTIGYLQLETASMSMNNSKSNFFNENTFTFEYKDVPKETITEITKFIIDKVDAIKASK